MIIAWCKEKRIPMEEYQKVMMEDPILQVATANLLQSDPTYDFVKEGAVQDSSKQDVEALKANSP